ncbi:hypothetical protein [Flavobacterium coralii]|uniref:DUF6712 family protein n=1 Tax=Flavobacterium coralii TaxID=2838017 RepID=UPI000C3D0E66|nr:hypothetical protein [Flavobacterium sp.]|tara:strand:- start:6143 stop:6649 length:507 start_codon:yes stop_codon:yes gene_type:complete
MQPLITRSDIAKYRQISATRNDAKLNEMILDAQMLDVQPLLGEKLYNLIMNAPEDYTEIMDGGSYVYQGVTYNNYGLKMVIAYYAYARYIMFGGFTDTPHSFVEKLNDSTSRPVDYSNKKTVYQLNRENAAKIWDSVSNYLIRTKNEDFAGYCKPVRTGAGLRLTKID